MTNWTTADIPSQEGRLALVTGANSGVGWQTALELARAGSEVILAVRSAEKGRMAVDGIRRLIPRARVRHEILDLASLQSVRAFAARLADEPRLDLLVNNAGVMSVPTRELTEDGFERQLGTNYLGPFALTALLLPLLRRSPSPRITTVSSGAANMGLRRINFDDLQWEKSYAPWKAYCQSKLADLLMAVELTRRASADGIKGADLRGETLGAGRIARCGTRGSADVTRSHGTECLAGQLLWARPVLPSQGRSRSRPGA